MDALTNTYNVVGSLFSWKAQMVFWKVKKKTYSETRQLEFFTCYGRSGPSCYASLYCVRIETHQTRYFVRETASLLLRSWSYLSLCKSDLLCPMHFVVLWWSRRQSFLGVPVPPVFLPRPRYLPRKITRHFDIFFSLGKLDQSVREKCSKSNHFTFWSEFRIRALCGHLQSMW